ncbi:Mitochondrial inner membrane protein isoform 1 [Schistosoma japonicum]|uniref:Mitochondrial inner membrane protein isoform 1 n=1 Tax=Schistosoma japonicum TaxID=6182 RepID=A0A4Z2DRP3_SCHJA|nr:Mitochondrial inner membrane protein isoform 1 [Schistosoma japonicum]
MLKSQVTRFQQYSYSTSALCYISNELFHPDHMHVKAITNLLLGIHDHLKFPWGITIATTAVLVRTAIAVPLYIYAEKNNAKVSHIAIDCQKNRHLVKTKLLNSEYYRKCTPNGQIILENRLFRRVFIKKCEENGCHPLKSSTVGIIQLPLWLTFTFSLRYLSGFQLSTHDFSHRELCNLIVLYRANVCLSTAPLGYFAVFSLSRICMTRYCKLTYLFMLAS